MPVAVCRNKSLWTQLRHGMLVRELVRFGRSIEPFYWAEDAVTALALVTAYVLTAYNSLRLLR